MPTRMMEPYSLTSRLVRARKLRGLSQAQLGEAIGKPQTVSDWEAGRYKPGFDSIRAICRALRIRPDFLFGFEDSVFAARVPGGESI